MDFIITVENESQRAHAKNSMRECSGWGMDWYGLEAEIKIGDYLSIELGSKYADSYQAYQLYNDIVARILGER